MKKILLVFSALSLVLVLAGCDSSKEVSVDTFADCLTTKGLVMYGSDTCLHCIEQKKLFGDSFDKIAYVNCSFSQSKLQECLDAGIKGTPTWRLDDGVLIEGALPLEKLAELSNCELSAGA